MVEVCAVFCYCLLWLDRCIWCMFVFMSVVVTVWVCRNVCCVTVVVKENVF